MARFVLSDAAPLICLAQIDSLPWLKALLGRVHITREVRDEILTGRGKPGEEVLVRAIERRLLRVHPEWEWIEPQFSSLGKGEASCICATVNLIKRGHDCLLLMDDREARRTASSLSVTVSGTAAVVGMAKRIGLITSARAVFDELQHKGFRISEAIVQAILESVSEEPRAKPVGKAEGRRAKDSSSKRQRKEQ